MPGFTIVSRNSNSSGNISRGALRRIRGRDRASLDPLVSPFGRENRAMGSRENQGLQIALILFVAVTVLLAATTYIYWRKSDELAKEVQQRTTAAHDADATRVAAVAESAQVKA